MFLAASRYAAAELAKPADRATAEPRHCCRPASTGLFSLHRSVRGDLSSADLSRIRRPDKGAAFDVSVGDEAGGEAEEDLVDVVASSHRTRRRRIPGVKRWCAQRPSGEPEAGSGAALTTGDHGSAAPSHCGAGYLAEASSQVSRVTSPRGESPSGMRDRSLTWAPKYGAVGSATTLRPSLRL